MKSFTSNLILAFLFTFLSQIGWGQILTFEFSALAGNEASAGSNFNDANLSASTITRGAGLTASNNGGRFNATSWALTNINNAVTGNDYMEFTISPNSGYQFSISSIYIQLQRSSTGPRGVALRSSLDGYTTNLDQEYSITDITSTQNFTFTFSQANSASAVTYRIYKWAESTLGSGGIGDGAGDDIIVNGTVTSSGPVLSVTPSTLSNLDYVLSFGPSAEQTYVLSGTNLDGTDVTLTPPTNYEISKTSGAGFVSAPSTLTYTAYDGSNQTVYVRLKSGLSIGTYNNEIITNAGGGATTVNVTCNGEVTAVPTVVLADNGTQITPADVEQGTVKHALHTFQLTVSDADATLTQADFRSAGTYLSADIDKFQLWYNTSNDLASASQLGSDITTSLGAGSHSFIGLYQTVAVGTAYFWITTDIDAAATIGNTINANAVLTTDLTFSGANKSGSTSAGGEQTIIAITVPAIFISEFAGSGYNADFNDEYFELTNNGVSVQSLVGWTLEYYNSSGTIEGGAQSLTGSIAANSAYLIAARNTSGTINGIIPDFTCSGIFMNSTGWVVLKDGVGTIIDQAGSTGDRFSDGTNYEFTDCTNDNLPVSNWDNLATGNGTPGVVNCTSSNDADSEASIPTGGQQAGSAISSLADTDPEAVDVFKFDIDDLGTSDGLLTSVTNIRIFPHSTNTADWSDHIQGVKLDNGGAVTIGASTITDTYIDIPITAGELDIADGASSTLTMSVYLNTSNMIDGAVLSFMIDADMNGFTAHPAGSTFASTFTGGDFNSNDFIIDVTATELQFVQQPVDTEINEIMIPVVTVEAIDENGNRDLDNSALVSLSSSGTMNAVSSITLASGFGTFGDIVHTVSGTDLSLTASTPSLTDVISDLFDIIVINYITGDYRTLQSGTWLSNTGDGVWEFFNGSSWDNPHNSPAYSTSATLYIRYGHTITSGGSFGNSVNINVSGGEFIVDHPSTAATVVVRSGNFTVNPSTAFVIPVSGSVTVKEDGIFNLNSSGVSMTSDAVFTVENGGQLKLNNTGLRNNNTFWDGIEDFQDGSIVELLDWDWTASATFRSLINIDTDISDNAQGYKFGNFIFNANPGDDWTMIGGGIGVIELCYNNFIIYNSSANYISGASNSTSTNGYIINGNLIVNSGNFSFGSSYSPDPFDHQFTINGNFEYNGTGDLKIHRNGTSTADNLLGKVTINGNMTVNSAASFTQDLPTDLADLMYIDFSGTSTQEINIGCTVNTVSFNVKPDAEVQLVSNNLILNSSVGATNAFTVETGGTLHFGWDDDGTTPLIIRNAASPSGTNEFTSEQGSILKITHTEGVSTTASTGNVQVSPSNISYNQTATFHYIGKTNQETGNGITSGSVGKVIIVELADNSIELALTNSTGLSEAVTIHANGGHLDVRSGILRETETEFLSGSGTIVMTDGRYIIHRSSQDASDLIPRLIGNTFAYNLSGGSIELSSDVTYDGTTFFGQILRGARDYYGLTFSGGGDKRISSALTDIDGTVSIVEDNTELDVENNEFSGTGNLSMTDNSIFKMSSLNNTLPELSGIYSLTGGTVELYGTGSTQTHSLRGTDASKGTITYNNVEINAIAENVAFDQGNVVAGASFNVAGIMNINSPACFKIGSDFNIAGIGTFDLKPGATLKYGSAEGIVTAGANGNIRTSTRTFSLDASYGLCGTVSPQFVGNALPANILNLYLEKIETTDSVILNTVQINGDMILREGVLQIDADPDTPVLCDIGGGNGNVSIESGATLEVIENKAITVNGTITNTPGASGIIIRSDATGTGSLIHSTGGITATVERFITGDQWHYMFTPLSSVTSSILTLEGGTTNQNYYTYDESTKDYWNATTIYETTGWTAGPVNLPVDKGFIFNRIGLPDKVYSQTGGNLFEGQKDFSVTYTTNTGAIGNGCVNNWAYYDGWNLIGNPYTSAIDWDAVTKTNIENGIYFYDGSNYQYYINGGGSSTWDVGITLNGGSQYIPFGQGFMVKATTSGTLALQNDDRVHNSQGFWKNNNDLIPNIIRLQIEKDAYSDETLIRTLPEESTVTIDHDGLYDAYKQFAWDNTKPQLYSKNAVNSMYYAINSMPEFNEIMTVPLGVYIGEPGDYLLNMTENNFENIHIWLEDKFLETETNLLNNSQYNFTYSAQNNEDRFFIHFGINHEPMLIYEIPNQDVFVNEYYSYTIPTGIFYDSDFEDELTLSASLSSGDDLPDWLTFDADLEQFFGTPEDVQTLNIKLTARDVFGENVSDEFVLNVKSAVSVNEIVNYFHIYPNPTNGLINIELSKLITSGIVKIKDATGQVVFVQNINSKRSEIDLSSLSKGIYFIEIRTDKINVNKKIVLN